MVCLLKDVLFIKKNFNVKMFSRIDPKRFDDPVGFYLLILFIQLFVGVPSK